MSNEPQDNQPRMRRATRYTKAQERRLAQSRADQKFYAQMFTVCGVLALFVIGLGLVAMNGVSTSEGNETLADMSVAWLGPFSKLELFGLALVVIIAIVMYLRMRKRG
jgi:hypothetical protein